MNASFSPSLRESRLLREDSPSARDAAEENPPERTRLHLDILPQPDDVTCGPTCLHAVYRYFGDFMPVSRVVEEIAQLLAISPRAAYNLCNTTKDFRVLRIGTSIRVNKQSFDDWFAAV